VISMEDIEDYYASASYEGMEDYYEELETQTIEKEKKRDKKVITKMVVDGAGIKTVIINRRYKKLLEEYEL